MSILWWALWGAACGADDARRAASAVPPAGSTGAAPAVLLKLDKTPWPKALEQVAKPLGLQVRLDFEPPGTVTYADAAPRPAAEALDLLHGILLDRGVGLVRRGDQLVACRLADETHFTHAPFLPIEDLRARRDTLMASTTLRLNSLLALDAKAELSGMLSPRGRIVNLALNNRIAVCDRADSIRALDQLLALIDPPGKAAASRLKTYAFQYGKASEAANVARELLGLEVEENEALPQSVGGLANQFVNKRNAKRMGRMFVPGMMDMMGGGAGGGEGSEHDPKVRLTVDTERNLVFVHGPYEKLGYLDTLLKSLDAPPAPGLRPGVQVDLRVFAVVAGDGEAVAKKLKAAAAHIPGLLIAGSKDKVIAKGPKDKLAEVQTLFEQLNPAAMQFAAFPTGDASAQAVARQLGKLFAADPEATRPLLAASARDDQLVVRGTAGQVARIRAMMKGYGAEDGEPAKARPAAAKSAARAK